MFHFFSVIELFILIRFQVSCLNRSEENTDNGRNDDDDDDDHSDNMNEGKSKY